MFFPPFIFNLILIEAICVVFATPIPAILKQKKKIKIKEAQYYDKI